MHAGADSDGHWKETLSYTEKVKLNIARAFVMNPEVLVLQRPLHPFSSGETDAQEVFGAIRRHVMNRGVHLDEATRHRRRPRTCFFSTARLDRTEGAGVILFLEGSSVRLELCAN